METKNIINQERLEEFVNSLDLSNVLKEDNNKNMKEEIIKKEILRQFQNTLEAKKENRYQYRKLDNGNVNNYQEIKKYDQIGIFEKRYIKKSNNLNFYQNKNKNIFQVDVTIKEKHYKKITEKEKKYIWNAYFSFVYESFIKKGRGFLFFRSRNLENFIYFCLDDLSSFCTINSNLSRIVQKYNPIRALVVIYHIAGERYEYKMIRPPGDGCYNPHCRKMEEEIDDDDNNDNKMKSITKFKRCSQCRSAWYCSKNCQIIHWYLFHRFSCYHIMKK